MSALPISLKSRTREPVAPRICKQAKVGGTQFSSCGIYWRREETLVRSEGDNAIKRSVSLAETHTGYSEYSTHAEVTV